MTLLPFFLIAERLKSATEREGEGPGLFLLVILVSFSPQSFPVPAILLLSPFVANSVGWWRKRPQRLKATARPVILQ